jgi:hypothetical protein
MAARTRPMLLQGRIERLKNLVGDALNGLQKRPWKLLAVPRTFPDYPIHVALFVDSFAAFISIQVDCQV